jgi:hypothetical protein
MKKATMICLALVFGICLATGAMAADEAAIQGNVDGIVAGIDGGKAATDYNAGDYDPYVFVMEKDGMLLVHPKLQGQSLNSEKYQPVYDALIKSQPEGVWVEYEWGGSMKKSYVRTTQSGLIVGSGYTK